MTRFLLKNCLFLLVIGLLGCKSTAPLVPVPEPGDHVRITVPDMRLDGVEGTLMSSTMDTLVVDALHVPRMSVSTYEVISGKKGHTGTGALIGALLGGGIMLAVTYAEVEKNGCVDLADDWPCFAGFGGAGAIVGGNP